MFLHSMFIPLSMLTHSIILHYTFTHSKHAKLIESSNASVFKKLKEISLECKQERCNLHNRFKTICITHFNTVEPTTFVHVF